MRFESVSDWLFVAVFFQIRNIPGLPSNNIICLFARLLFFFIQYPSVSYKCTLNIASAACCQLSYPIFYIEENAATDLLSLHVYSIRFIFMIIDLKHIISSCMYTSLGGDY